MILLFSCCKASIFDQLNSGQEPKQGPSNARVVGLAEGLGTKQATAIEFDTRTALPGGTSIFSQESSLLPGKVEVEKETSESASNIYLQVIDSFVAQQLCVFEIFLKL